jgi:hypothetical protein
MINGDEIYKKLVIILLYYIPFDFFIQQLLRPYLGFEIGLSKDFIFLILIAFSLHKLNWKFKGSNLSFIVLFLFISINIVYVLTDPTKTALVAFRNYCLPLILLFSLISYYDLRLKVISHLPYILLLICLGGLFEYFIAHESIARIKDVILSINNSRIIYDTPSYTMYGYTRMSGFSSGPNGFGLILSFLIALINIVFRNKSIVVKSILILGLLCLLMSVSRAGIAFLLISQILYFKTATLKYIFDFRLIIGLVIVIILSLAFIGYENVEKLYTLYELSVKLEDASSEARFEQVGDGATMFVTNIVGAGLGRTDKRYATDVTTFYESAWINMVYEIGFILFYLYIIILFTYRFNDKLYFAIISTYLITGIFSINPVETSYLLFVFLSLVVFTKSEYKNINNQKYINRII